MDLLARARCLMEQPVYYVSRRLATIYGPRAAFLAAIIMDEIIQQDHFKKLDDEGYALLFHNDLIEKSGMSLHQLQSAKKVLIGGRILFVKMKGLPAKQWYKLNPAKLI